MKRKTMRKTTMRKTRKMKLTVIVYDGPFLE
jgi:hypothetical protein